MKIDPRKPPDTVTQRALAAIANAMVGVPPGGEQEQLLLIATMAICMIHGTYGTQYCRDYLRGATEELDLPDAMKIELEVRAGPKPTVN